MSAPVSRRWHREHGRQHAIDAQDAAHRQIFRSLIRARRRPDTTVEREAFTISSSAAPRYRSAITSAHARLRFRGLLSHL